MNSNEFPTVHKLVDKIAHYWCKTNGRADYHGLVMQKNEWRI